MFLIPELLNYKLEPICPKVVNEFSFSIIFIFILWTTLHYTSSEFCKAKPTFSSRRRLCVGSFSLSDTVGRDDPGTPTDKLQIKLCEAHIELAKQTYRKSKGFIKYGVPSRHALPNEADYYKPVKRDKKR